MSIAIPCWKFSSLLYSPYLLELHPIPLNQNKFCENTLSSILKEGEKILLSLFAYIKLYKCSKDLLVLASGLSTSLGFPQIIIFLPCSSSFNSPDLSIFRWVMEFSHLFKQARIHVS